MGIAIERILNLMESNGINAARLHAACNLDSTSVSKWKQGKQNPSAEALLRIADYFDVSVDYLLGRTDNPYPSDYIPKNSIPYEIIKKWERLSQNEIKMISDMINNLVVDR